MSKIERKGKVESIEEIYRNFTKSKVYRTSIESIKYSEKEIKVIKKSKLQQKVALLVEDLYKQFGHLESLDFYRWWAWRLVKGDISENEYYSTIEIATQPRIYNQHNYFIKVLADKKRKIF